MGAPLVWGPLLYGGPDDKHHSHRCRSAITSNADVSQIALCIVSVCVLAHYVIAS